MLGTNLGAVLVGEGESGPALPRRELRRGALWRGW